ncbi:MAG: hypothetical protein IJ209_00265 [Bacteroidaceae bacterium]|nr:hypothetical protein [Bacteroidaceae bacterium]
MKMYSINDLVNGASKLATSVFGKREKYVLQFNHEDDGCWYVDYPNWPFDHHNLMMVSGADRLCEVLSDDNRVARVEVIPSSKELDLPDYAKLTQLQSSLAGGSTYEVTNLPTFSGTIWLCPVTLFVLGEYPKYLYVRKNESQ